MKNKRRKIGNILIITGLVMLLGAAGLFIFNMCENNLYDEESDGLADMVKTHIGETSPSEQTDPADRQDAQDNVPGLKVQYVENASVDGILTIPAVNLEKAVYDTWNDDLLRKSVCRYFGSPYTDDLVIAGHNYRNGFGKLKRLKAGDEVFFTDMKGNVTRYVVKQTEVIDGTDVTGMISGGWHLSLYTCTYGGKARFTVRCMKE
jgi:sortase A